VRWFPTSHDPRVLGIFLIWVSSSSR
jgi:hypothetical protein